MANGIDGQMFFTSQTIDGNGMKWFIGMSSCRYLRMKQEVIVRLKVPGSSGRAQCVGSHSLSRSID